MSRYAPVPFPQVKLEGQFWHERLDTVLGRTVPSQHKKLAEVGILDSLKLPDPPPPLRFPRHANGFTVQVFWDSDVGKWIEAASYALAHRRDADIEAKIEAAIDDLEKAQAPDGYLNCWYLGREPDKRWTNQLNQALLEAYSYSNQPVIINPSPQTVDLKRSRSMDSDLRLSASTRMNEASDQI